MKANPGRRYRQAEPTLNQNSILRLRPWYPGERRNAGKTAVEMADYDKTLARELLELLGLKEAS